MASRERIDYLPGELSLPRNMKGKQYLKVVDNLRKTPADPAYLSELCERLDLDANRKIRDNSSGNKQKLGLVAALMGKPELLMPDEPTIGLEPFSNRLCWNRSTRPGTRDERSFFLPISFLRYRAYATERGSFAREGWSGWRA